MPDTGQSWCSESRAANPIFRNVTQSLVQHRHDVVVLECPVGYKHEWIGNAHHAYRTDPALHLVTVPTLWTFAQGVYNPVRLDVNQTWTESSVEHYLQSALNQFDRSNT